MSENKRSYIVRRSSIHNRGLYARERIEKGEYILQYFGEKITKAESQRRSKLQEKRARKSGTGQVYIFELNKKYDLDGYRKNNPARYINHSCEPNCEAVNYKGQIWVVALRDIDEGEELSYDYGYALDCFMDHPCRCGKKSCPGYIVNEADRPKLRKILNKRKKK